ncbi:MAG TPA: hypothetical protein VMS31_13145 [Pyrinomonadaceae bacterium]|nr:hypothetical protein [Pyrinomonadaceae bacterium]
MKKLFLIAEFVVALSITSPGVFAQSRSHADLVNEIAKKRTELQKLETSFLAPAEEDGQAYAEFLKQPHTGLIRLLPREKYESEAYKKNEKTLAIRGGGAYYSFVRLTHEFGYGSDIGLESDYLSMADHGMLTKLGDVSLGEITFEQTGARFIATYNPPGEESKARLEYRRFGDGATIDNELYQRRVPVEVNQTYLLRSISYDRSDVLVAFRTVRKEADGSLIIAWKLLKSYPKTALIRNIPEQ